MSSEAPVLLRDEPDWEAAAQSLVDGCARLETPEQRVRFLERVCLPLGDALYPAFLKMLCLIGEYGDGPAQRVVAETLVHALSTGRIPSGRLSAWGGMAAGEGAALGMSRRLGPVEYLCAWHAQQSGPSPLSMASFDSATRAIVGLVSSSEAAKAMYCAKLRQDIDDPLSGSLTRSTRSALSALVSAWERGAPADAVVQALLDDLNGGTTLTRLSNVPGGHWSNLR